MKQEIFNQIKDKKYVLTGKQLVKLLESDNKLNVLECNGVDNWEGFTYYFDSDYDCEEDYEDRINDESLVNWKNFGEVGIEELKHYEELKTEQKMTENEEMDTQEVYAVVNLDKEDNYPNIDLIDTFENCKSI